MAAFNDYDDPARVKLHRQESTKMNEPHTEFRDDHTPTAYLITFRIYGTWPHGDNRGSVDRFHKGYGTPMLPANAQRRQYERSLLTRAPVTLNAKQRKSCGRARNQRALHVPQVVALGFQHSNKPCSFCCVRQL